MVDEFRRVATEVILPYLMQNTGKEIIKRAKTILHVDGKEEHNGKLTIEE